jgi:hypothetical protein
MKRCFNNIIFFLPVVIIDIIKEYINDRYLVFTNKQNYILYHSLIRCNIQKYDSYIRDTIIRDNSFVFERIIKENSERWLKNNDYIYKNILFKKYIYFTMHYCIENESLKCKKIIDNLFQELGLSKNQHKKNLAKYIIWKN